MTTNKNNQPDATANSPRTVSALLLPYDRLPSPSSKRRRIASHRWVLSNDDLPITSGREIAEDSLIASIVWLYKISGQSAFDIDVLNLGESANIRQLCISISGGTSLGKLAGIVASDSAYWAENHVDEPSNVRLDLLPRGSSDGQVRDAPECELRLAVRERADVLEFDIFYDTDLFNAASIERMQGHIENAVQLVRTEKPELKLSEIGVLTKKEVKWLAGNGQGRSSENEFDPIYRQFEACAASFPHRTAVVFEGQESSYRDVNAAANRLARWLVSVGTRIGDRIVVCLDPCPEVPVSLLAIHKAGCTYVPLNPAHPKFRIDTILEDTVPAAVVCQRKHAVLFDDVDTIVLLVEELDEVTGELADDDLKPTVGPETAAYVFYTSGTTGKPKGVLASHSNMFHMVTTSRRRYDITSDDVIPSVASYTFSISMFELMSPLSVGGTLILLPREKVLDPAKMAYELENVSLFHIGPSLLKKIVQQIKDTAENFDRYRQVRHASSGGDMVPPELLQDLRAIFVEAEVFVIYGCSEISLMGCTWEVKSRTVPRSFVGRVFDDVSLLVLDDDGCHVPVGVVGNVCFGGRGVVDGYLNRSELTTELFFERDAIRYYSTGDRGRLDHEGNLELLGRRDFQIQLRGMRIELAEIDYHLRAASGVRDAVAATIHREDGEMYLAAYVVMNGNTTFDATNLRHHMIDRLPDYMVPSIFVELEALPLNHNMKIDRNALPDPELRKHDSTVMPRTDTEKKLATMWSQLLAKDAFGIYDNFMALGGDSLLAMRFILLTEKEFGCTLDGLQILRESLAVLASLVDEATGFDSPTDTVGSATIRNSIQSLHTFYFGGQSPIYGVHAAAEGDDRTMTPVVICSALGYEYSRCQYLVQLLSQSLASRGCDNLRFDFLGTGDSGGDSREATLQIWIDNVRQALDQLRSQTNREDVRIFCFGLGAAITCAAMSERRAEKIVMWNPVLDGRRYIQESRRMSEDKAKELRVIRNLRLPGEIAGAEELLGAVFSDEMIDQIESILRNNDLPAGEANIVQILSADFPADIALSSKSCRTVLLQEDSNWFDSNYTASAITNRSILDAVVGELTSD